MLGKAMRIATICTLAFATCGERMDAEEKKEEKTSDPLRRRLLVKSLLLGASMHAVKVFGLPVHSVVRFGRPAGVSALGPLKVAGRDTSNDPWRWKRMVEKGNMLLAEINDKSIFYQSDAEWYALEDDVWEFTKWQEEARERYGYQEVPSNSGIPWEEYDIDNAPVSSRFPNLDKHLQRMKGTMEGAKRDAGEEKRDAEEEGEWE